MSRKGKPPREPDPAHVCAACGIALPRERFRTSRVKAGAKPKCRQCHLTAISPLGNAAISPEKKRELGKAAWEKNKHLRTREHANAAREARRAALAPVCAECERPAVARVAAAPKRAGTWYCEAHGPPPPKVKYGGPGAPMPKDGQRVRTWDEFRARTPAELFGQYTRACAEHGVSLHEAFGTGRMRAIVAARHACWVIVRARGWSYPEIANAWGRDHSTVLIAIREAPPAPPVDVAAYEARIRVLEARIAELEKEPPGPFFVPIRAGARVIIG